MSASKWTVEGQLNETPEINSARGRTHAIIRLDVGTGEIVFFAHDEFLLADIRKLKAGESSLWRFNRASTPTLTLKQALFS